MGVEICYRNENGIFENLINSVLLDRIYPIGSIYMSLENNSPSSFLGGTWEKVNDNKYWLPGSAAGNVGGSPNLTTAQMPSHTHAVSGTAASAGAHTHTVGPFKWGDDWPTGTVNNWTCRSHESNQYTATSSSAGAHTHTVSGTAAATGSGHEYWQPYRICHCWRRTA